MLWELYHVTWHSTIDSTEDFVVCLVACSLGSASNGVPQTQEDVDNYCAAQCGTVPSTRPNPVLVSIIIVCDVFSICVNISVI